MFSVFGIDPKEMIIIITDKLEDDVEVPDSWQEKAKEIRLNLNSTKCSVTVVKCMDCVGKKKDSPECGSNETAQIIH